jgi:hypothetical protein
MLFRNSGMLISLAILGPRGQALTLQQGRSSPQSLREPAPGEFSSRNSESCSTSPLINAFPSQVISKRNDKKLDHARYLARKLPTDLRSSEEFLVLTAQLLEELPRFLASVSKYFNIIVAHFGGVQAAYHEAVQERWDAYAEHWIVQIPEGSYEEIENSFVAQSNDVANMLNTLVMGLGITGSRRSPCGLSSLLGLADLGSLVFEEPAPSTPPSRSRQQVSRSSQLSTGSNVSTPVPNQRFSSPVPDDAHRSGLPGRLDDCTISRTHSSPNRSSVDSDLSVPSFTTATTSTSASLSSSQHRWSAETPPTPRYSTDSLSPRLSSPDHRLLAPQLKQSRRSSEASHFISAYLEEGEDDDEEEQEMPSLYTAEAMSASRSSAFRSGYPVLSFNVSIRSFFPSRSTVINPNS